MVVVIDNIIRKHTASILNFNPIVISKQCNDNFAQIDELNKLRR